MLTLQVLSLGAGTAVRRSQGQAGQPATTAYRHATRLRPAFFA